MWPYRNFLVVIFLLIAAKAYCQQDVEFHLNDHLLAGKTIIKVKRDFHDPYLWVLAKNNEVFRVNSITKAVDDYTTQFAAYNNLEFIDIAGNSQDQVFIATKSPGVIQFKNGIVNIIGGAAGIKDEVTSVGIDYTGRITGNIYDQFGNVLLVGTVKGLYRYNIDAGTALLASGKVYSRVFEATYRKDLFSGIDYGNQPDSITYYPVEHNSPQTTYIAYTWLGGKSFGENLRTAFYTPFGFGNDGFVQGTNLFWGTEKGMAQVNSDRSYSTQWPSGHYLGKIQINKITDIFGLTTFGSDGILSDPALIKQNLLIGTDKGLYFSNTMFNNFDPDNFSLRKFELFHYDELGNIRINDICVNAVKTTPPLCEDGVWLACDDGLYLIKPDYAKYINNQKFQALSFEGQDDNISETKICAGSSATAVLNTYIYTGNAIQWYKDGKELPGQNKQQLLIKTAGDYYALLYDPCGNIHMESNHLTVQVIAGPVFSFNYPEKMPYCNNTPVVLKTDNNPGYTYRWYTNGALNGETTSSFTVTQTGKYKVEVSACTNSWVPSKEVEVDLITLPVPQVTADKVIYCAEDEATLSVNVPAATDYTINWYRDGNLLNQYKDLATIKTTTGGNYTVTVKSNIADCSQTSLAQQVIFTPAPVFTFNYPDELRYCKGNPVALNAVGSSSYKYRWYKDGVLTEDITSSLSIIQSGKYKVEVSDCDGSWVPSREVQVDLVQLPVPVIATDKPAYCISDQAQLSVNVPTASNYTINWYRDNVLLPGNQNQTSWTSTVAGNYTVSVINNDANSDESTCSEISSMQAIVFNPPPTASITQIVKTTLCEGQTVDLKVVHSVGTVRWSTGETGDQISITQAGNYKATVTTVAGCTTDAATDVVLLPLPEFSVKDESICTYTHQIVTLNAPPGFSQYAWNGQAGGQTYQADHPQTVSLTITDVNGCQATRQINVTEQCADVHIPNTFTPNGDGINDTWNIGGLEYDQTAVVKVFSRYGQLVYERKGYGTPWNGSKGNQQLPTGTYYYIITARNGGQKFSGYVAIIY